MMYSLAGVYFAQDRLTDARAEVEKILLFEPQNPRAVELRGMIEQKSSGLEVGQYSAH
jgi:Tfp pilus assembly protein PilF